MKNINFLLAVMLSLVCSISFAQETGSPGLNVPEAGIEAEAGKCYAKCYIADQYETSTEQVLVREASTNVTVSPATFETKTENLLAKEASTTLSVSPATFETKTEQVMTQEAGKKVSISPATFETVTEQVLKLQDAPGVAVIPAKFETVTEEVLVKEAHTQLRVVPAKFETVTEQVLVQEAHTKLKVVPAEYETVTEQVLLKEGYTVLQQAPSITDLKGLLEMVEEGRNSYTTSSGVTRVFTAEEIANIKSLQGQSTTLSTDQYGNVYATMTEQVLAKEGYSTLSTSPATYETVTEQVLLKEAATRIETQPAGFETVTETIVTSPASTRWERKRVNKNCLSANPDDCLVWCLVEVPQQTKTVTKQVKKACPAGWTESGFDCYRSIEIPAEYGTRTYQKLASAASSSRNDVPAEYTTRTWKKLIIPAATVAKQVPAEYGSRTYRKVVKPASTVAEEVPAQYTSRTYQKLVSAATTEVVEVPAKYESRTYRKLVSDASTQEVACGKSSILKGINFRTASAELLASSNNEIARLERLLKDKPQVTARLIGHTDSDGSEASNQRLSEARAKAVYDALVAKGIDADRLSYEGKGESSPIATNATAEGKRQNRRTEFITFGDNDGEGDCTVYEMRSYQKLANDASVSTDDVPAQYGTRSYQVLASDAAVTSTEVPARYEDRSYQVLASAATTSTTEVPAQYTTITKRDLVRKGGFSEWREVVCDVDVTPEFIRRVQRALIDKGYALPSHGTDNIFGPETKAALVKFQRANGLPIGALDFETLKALGVER